MNSTSGYTTHPERPLFQYQNVTLSLGTIQATPDVKVESKEEQEIDPRILSIIQKYLEIIGDQFPTTEELHERIAAFRDAKIAHCEMYVYPIEDEEMNLRDLVYVVNGILIDVKKLPPPPLVIDGDTINGLPLDMFTYEEQESEKDLWSLQRLFS